MKKNIIRIWKTYSLYDLTKLVFDICVTKIKFPQARIIRSPFYFRGRKYMQIGRRFTSGVGLRLDCFPKEDNTICIKIGENVQMNDYVHIGAINSVEIGNNVLIASKVFITDHNHGYYGYLDIHTNPNIVPFERDLSSSPVIIQDNVWIGEFVSILPGITIGKGCIIGAMSLVNKDIPPYSIAVGIPAMVIKKFNFISNQWEKI